MTLARRFLLTVLPLLILLPRLAQATPASDLLARDLSLGIKPFPRESRIYNYFNIPQAYSSLGERAGRDEFVERYIQSVIGRFWDPSYHDSYAINSGPGLYFAIDPSISRSFGNSMIEFNVPSGISYVTVVRPQPIQDETVQALLDEGILRSSEVPELFVPSQKPKVKWGFYRDTLKHMVAPGHDSFRNLVQTIFSNKNVQMIEYNWNTSLAGFCLRNSYSAFVYIGPRPNSGETPELRRPLLSSDLDLQGLESDEVDLSQRTKLLRDTLAAITLAAKNQVKPSYSALILQSYSPMAYRELAGHLYSCEARNVQ